MAKQKLVHPKTGKETERVTALVCTPETRIAAFEGVTAVEDGAADATGGEATKGHASVTVVAQGSFDQSEGSRRDQLAAIDVTGETGAGANHEMLSCFLVGGWSRSEAEAGWRNYLVREMHDVHALAEPFMSPRPGFNPDDPAFRQVYCRVGD